MINCILLPACYILFVCIQSTLSTKRSTFYKPVTCSHFINMVKYKLVYFGIRGRAEPLRFIFAQAGIQYEDCRIKPEEWMAVKDTFPNKQLPVLYVDKEPLPQTRAIRGYLAREFGLDGKTSWEKGQVDRHCENIADLFMLFYPAQTAMYKDDQAAADEHIKKFRAENWPEFAQRYDGFVKASKSGFLVGDAVTAADLSVAEVLDRLDTSLVPGMLADWPNIKAYVDRIHALPNIKKYVESRPVTKF